MPITDIIMTDDKILLGHGSGGRLMHELIRDHFIRHFKNEFTRVMSDSTVLPAVNSRIALTTDSFVVDPVFFPGGDIGKLAVCGTVNDLAVSGADPLYLTTGFIIEEGFPLSDLEKILVSMSREAKIAGVSIVAGDTKVVEKGKCDKIFINTTGFGTVNPRFEKISTGELIEPGDMILVNGSLGDHGMAIMASRGSLNFKATIESDCASLNSIIKLLLNECPGIKFMRDATRGGLASVLCEISEERDWGIELDEEAIPVNPGTRGLCEILGFDPVYVANEGKVVIVIDNDQASKALELMKNHDLGRSASIIGKVTDSHAGRVLMNTEIGGKRILDMLAGEQLPRIC
jgi:hydrogenase expression/formation protein HypE